MSQISKVRELTAKLNQWRHEYYNADSPTVTDAVYDRHYDELERLEEQTGIRMSNSPTQTVGYEVVDGLEKTAHPIPLLSLEKTKELSEITRFIGSKQVLLMHKLDGLTVKVEYENGSLIRASTRGNGDEGEVVTHNAKAIDGIPKHIPYLQRLVVVGEAYITKPVFERLRDKLRDSSDKPFKNPRNMAAGSIRSYDAASCAGRGLVFSPFNVLEGLDEDDDTKTSKYEKLQTLNLLGFSPCMFIKRDKNASEQITANIISNMKKIADADGLPIDGIVITYDDIPYSLACGRTNHHNKDSIAFKFADDLRETVLRDIEWTPSRFGEISPVAILEPVEMDGCEVSRASLHNLTFISELELMPGCRVLVSKRNMIIPHIEDNLDRGGFDSKIVFPIFCPSCDFPTSVKETHAENGRIIRVLRCNNASCSIQRLRQFVHFVGKKAMDIEGLSEATLEKFIGKGWLRDFTDIYHLDEHARKIVLLEGFGEKSWQRLWDAIQRSRITTFERYLVAMDIPMIGRTASRKLSSYFNGDLSAFETAVNNKFDFTRLNNFGEVLHKNIYAWFSNENNKTLWKELQKMTAIENKNTAVNSGGTESPFAGRTIVVTGTLENFTRSSISAKIESLGAKVGSTVSKNTDFLLYGEKAGSKLDKARSLGVTLLSEDEFLGMAEGA